MLRGPDPETGFRPEARWEIDRSRPGPFFHMFKANFAEWRSFYIYDKLYGSAR
jgi:hypothetical protein